MSRRIFWTLFSKVFRKNLFQNSVLKGIERTLRVCFEFYDLQASTMYFELGFFLVGERGDVKVKNGRIRGYGCVEHV